MTLAVGTELHPHCAGELRRRSGKATCQDGVGREQDVVGNAGLHPGAAHPRCCCIPSRVEWRNSCRGGGNAAWLGYLQPLISQTPPSQTLVTQWVWTEMLFLVDGPGSKALPCVWDSSQSLPGVGQPTGSSAGTSRGVLVPATSQGRHLTGGSCACHIPALLPSPSAC